MPDNRLDELAVETAALAARLGQVAATLATPSPRTATASEHVRNAIQLLSNLLDLGALESSDRRQVGATIDLLWRGIREIEKGNV